MGRWGMRLFEGDQDLDISIDVANAMGWTDEFLGFDPTAEKTIPTGKELEDLKNLTNTKMREFLDTGGSGDKLLQDCRAEDHPMWGRYMVIIAAAVMMQTGAKIKGEDIQFLRELVPTIHSSPGYAMPMADEGFRDPGKVQFLAALDNYKPGVPRSFEEPSCFQCGKIAADLGARPMQCSRCKVTWYCNKDCQKQHWKHHKPYCVEPEMRRGLNV